MTLAGKKTYITALAAALTSFGLAMGWLSKEQYEMILGLLGALGLAALRSGVAKGVIPKIAAAGQNEPMTILGEAKSATGLSGGDG